MSNWYLTPLTTDPIDNRDYIYVPVAKYPDNLQHRTLVGEIEDQGNTGSCTANSVVSACEILLQKANNHRHLSRLFNYYVTRDSEKRLGQSGAYLRNAVKQASKLGLPDESMWSYDESKTEVKPPEDVYLAAANHKILRYERIQSDTTDGVIHCIKSAISEGFPVVFGTPVTQQWMNIRGGDITYRGVTDKDPQVGAHAMTIIGYSLDYFVIENSWGNQWGDRGLGYMHKSLAKDFFDIWVVREFDKEYIPIPVPEPTPPTPPAPQPEPIPIPPTPEPVNNSTEDMSLIIIFALIIIAVVLLF